MRLPPDLASIPLHRRKWTPKEFDALCRSGILGEDERIELIDGDLVTMTPPGERHTGVTGRLTTALALAGQGTVVVHSQSPVDCGDSRPQPDIAVVPRSEDTLTRFPRPRLVVEVADTSLRYDRAKAALYARAGVPEFWLVDVQAESVEVYTDPVADGRYRSIRVLAGEDALTSPLLPGLALTVSSLFRAQH